MNTELKNKGLAILQLLGATFTPKQVELNNDPQNYAVRGTVEGAGECYVQNSWHCRGKLNVQFSVDPEWCQNLWVPNEFRPTPSGNFSPDKSAEQIAKEVTRRILPSAKARFAAYSERAKSRDEGRRNRVATMAKVALAVPGARVELDQRTLEAAGVRFPWEYRSGYDCKVVPYGNDGAEVTIHGDPALVASIVALYAVSTKGGE